MKTGTGDDDAWGEEEDEELDDEAEAVEKEAAVSGEGEQAGAEKEAGVSGGTPERTTVTQADSASVGGQDVGGGAGAGTASAAGGGGPLEGMSREDLPLVVRRNTVDEERTEEILSKVRPEVASEHRDLVDDLERELGVEKVYQFDAREAAFMLVHDRPELLVPYLEQMGYNF